MTRQVIIPDWPWNATVGIAQAVRTGNTIHVSGQTARDGEGNLIGGSSTALQARKVFENIEYVLGLAGASMTDVVKLTAFFTEGAEFSEYASVRREFFPEITFAATGLTVTALADSGMLLEVEAVAVVD
ncbi:MAG: RidA family protein [Chloroflexi bacterium]|nr:RidA family protein [Chloroflexota bacterium]